jgi:hypothetical protein
MARTCAILTKNRVFGRGSKSISAYGVRGKKNFRILGNVEKDLRAFDEQLFWTPGFLRQRTENGRQKTDD